jgi:RHS repeat-associated protein
MANRVEQKDYRLKVNSPSGTIADSSTFEYDDASRLIEATTDRYSTAAGTITNTLAYDNASRTTSEALAVNFGTARTYTTEFDYDAANRLIEQTYPDGSVVDRGFTDRNQLDDVDYTPPAGAAAAVIDSLFDEGMRETQRTHGNGLITTRSYDRDDNLVTDIRVETSLSANDRTGLSFNYSASGYDANKNVLKETTGAPMAGYSWTTAGGATGAYDDEDRLTYWERTSGATTSLEWPQTSGQGLTKVGDWDTVKINGAAQSRTHGAAHELTAVGASSLSLDVKGNITQDTSKTNNHNYTWDFDNRMSFADVDGAAGDEIEYTYDALGRRVSKTFPVGMTTSTIVFTCMGGQVNSEYAANTRSNTPLCKYVYGQYIDEPLILIKVEVSKEEEKEEFVAVDSLTIVETKYYYHANRQYSVTGLTDSAKAVVERYAHTSYGDTTILAPNGTTVRTTSSYGNPYLYTGRRLDDETGLYYYRARYYDVELGRFLGRDPIGYAAGLSLYEYVRAQAVKATDPAGTMPGLYYGYDPASRTWGHGYFQQYPMPRNAHQSETAPWEKGLSGMGGRHTVNGAGPLLRFLLGYYAYPLKGELPYPSAMPYVQIHTDAFDEVPYFQSSVVTTEKMILIQKIRKAVADAQIEGRKSGRFSWIYTRENVHRSARLTGAGALGWALNGPHRMDVTHDVTVAWSCCGTNFSDNTLFIWHDQFDWNDPRTAFGNAESAWGYLFAFVESGLDGVMDFDYWFTLYYAKNLAGTLYIGDQSWTNCYEPQEDDVIREQQFDINGDLLPESGWGRYSDSVAAKEWWE